MNEDQLQALLSGYAAGTLTDGELKLLLERSLADQRVFDALAEEEPMRAALGDARARAVLLRALDPVEADELETVVRPMAAAAPMPAAPMAKPPRNRLLWVALACCIAVGGVSFSLWKKPVAEVPKEIAGGPTMAKPDVALPVVPETPKPLRLEPRRAPGATFRQPEPKVAQDAVKEKENTAAKAEPIETPAPAAAPAVVSDEAVKRAARQSIELSANAIALQAEAPAAGSELKKSIMADARRDASTERRRESPILPGMMSAAAAKARPAPVISIENNRLLIRSSVVGVAYAYLVENGAVRSLVDRPESDLAPNQQRDFAIAPYSPGAEVWVWIAPARDGLLDRLAAGTISLPPRNWVKLKLN